VGLGVGVAGGGVTGGGVTVNPALRTFRYPYPYV